MQCFEQTAPFIRFLVCLIANFGSWQWCVICRIVDGKLPVSLLPIFIRILQQQAATSQWMTDRQGYTNPGTKPTGVYNGWEQKFHIKFAACEKSQGSREFQLPWHA